MIKIKQILAEVMSMSTSSRSKSSGAGAKKGGQWRYKVYYDPQADEDRGPEHEIFHDELIRELEGLVDASERIEEVVAYDNPLSSWQLTKMVFYHEFLVFKTKQWWWSIEKHGESITIQRSKYHCTVREKHRRQSRNTGVRGINESRRASGKKSMKELIHWLYSSDQLKKEYNIVSSNCQTFAAEVYNYITE